SNGRDNAGVVLADRYRLEEPIAAGGMGEVWRATDTLLERNVAVKLLREALAHDPVVSERFRREALVAAQLSHPNMAGVYDYVMDNGRRGIVMEFVDGETLADRLGREGRLKPGEAVRITAALLSALQAAHDAGIIHRDVKPGNVMLTVAGGVKVTDFGIARAASDQTITETGMVIGTAQYLAPEQVSGKATTPASDLYSVGAILYEVLSGRKPFQAETPLAVAMMRLTDDPPPITTAYRRVPKALVEVVERAMAREPEHRYASADAMREALEEALGEATPATVPVRVDPEPTEVLPIAGAEAATSVIPRAAPEPPISPVAEKRRREYKRLGLFAIMLALVIGLIVMGALALTGGSDGGGTVTVPQFVAMQRADAEAAADQRGLRLDISDVASDRPEGEVLTQSNESGTELGRGETVKLTVSSGVPPEPAGQQVPDLKGEDEDEAKEFLLDNGFTVGKVTHETSTEVEEGKVIRTSPAAGETVKEGDEVDIVVSSGAPRKKGKGRGNG
ncbi:MAG: Stk1 family PASTA domain-containing Ser/Thr kinase, partial [Actinomycetota bacterium]